MISSSVCLKMNLDVVKYACSCGLLKPISQLYFCRYCFELRCGFCTCHEIDSNFCGKCLENLPSNEAKLKKNRCGNCYICPCCQQDLSTRVALKSTSDASEDTKSTATPKKMYYLLCLFCRWSSRDIGIPDQSTVTGGWPERENIHTNRLQEVLDMYKNVVQTQKQNSENFKKKQRGKYLSYTDKTGVTAAALRKRIGLPDVPHPLLKSKPKMPEQIATVEEVEDLPQDLLTKPLNLFEVPTIEQRLLMPHIQPATIDKLFPLHKQLSIKQSLRCKSCEHNVSKPEYNPSSVKFKIQLFAYYHIPEIRIVTVEPLRAGNASELILKFINPTQHETKIELFPITASLEDDNKSENVQFVADDVAATATKSDTSDQQSSSLDHGLLLSSQPSSLILTRPPSIKVKPRKITEPLNCNMEIIPNSSFVLPQRDDAAEYDDSGDVRNDNIQDDPKLVIRRKSNKAFIKLKVTPEKDLEIGSDVVCGFIMQHVYTNTITTTTPATSSETKQPQKVLHKIKVFLQLGKSVGS